METNKIIFEEKNEPMINLNAQILREHALIKPPEVDNKSHVKRIRYIVDSRDRNTNMYPDPAKYTINTEQTIRDIVKVELILTDFPFNDYNITQYNNVLHTSSGIFPIPPGKYTPPELAETITSLTPITVIYDSIKDKFILQGDGIVVKFLDDLQERYDDTLINVYPLNSIGKVLGFVKNNFELYNVTGIEAQYRVDLRSEDYIVMYMRPAKVYKSKNNKVMDAFAVINKEESNGMIKNGDLVSSKGFNPTLPTFDNLSFKFCDREGNLYDFQNKDHRMEFLFTCLSQTVSYTGIFK